MPTSHQTVKVSSWILPKNSNGHPIFANQTIRRTEVNYLNDIEIASGSQWNDPIDMGAYTKISIYGQVDANHPFYIFTNGATGKLNLLKEIFPETVDGEYHFFIQLENTPRYLYIATGNQTLTFTVKYTQIE